MKFKKTHTLFGFPCYGRNEADTLDCVDQLFVYCIRRGIPLTKQRAAGPHVYGVRNTITRDFLKNKKFTHCLMIDADMTFPPETLEVLLQLDKDIVSPVCMTKKGTVLEQRKIVPVIGIYDEEKKDYPCLTEIPDQPFQINGYVGTGVILIKRKVLETVPWPHFYGPKKERTIDYEMGVEGEDFMFCRNAIKAGFEIWVEPRLDIGHIGKYLFTVDDIGKTL